MLAEEVPEDAFGELSIDVFEKASKKNSAVWC